MITSLQNERVKEVIRLRDRQRRETADRFRIEGIRELAMALKYRVPVEALFVCEALIRTREEGDLVPRFAGMGVEIVPISEPVARKIAYRNNPEGLLAVAFRTDTDLGRLSPPTGGLVAILDELEKPGNLGAALRTADAGGVDALIATGDGVDFFNPNTVRASLGAVFSVPTANGSARQAVNWCRDQRLQVVAASPSGEVLYTEADLAVPTAIVVGSEDRGLDGLWLSEADLRVRIPQRGAVDSMNASASFAVLLFEAVRQRTQRAAQRSGSDREGSRT